MRPTVILLTGLPCAGKTTIAEALAKRLLDTLKAVVVLDGDNVRKHLFPELSFSREDRHHMAVRCGGIASMISACGGTAIISIIAPYRESRSEIRRLINPPSEFVEVYVATPREICVQRDSKKMYMKAAMGEIKEFTGVSDPYEEPIGAELTVDCTTSSTEEIVDEIMKYLRESE